MTHYNVSYKGSNDAQRAATLDLVRWFGFRKSLMLARYCRAYRGRMDSHTEGWKGFSFPVAIGGVTGFPVWNAYERWARTTLPYEDA